MRIPATVSPPATETLPLSSIEKRVGLEPCAVMTVLLLVVIRNTVALVFVELFNPRLWRVVIPLTASVPVIDVLPAPSVLLNEPVVAERPAKVDAPVTLRVPVIVLFPAPSVPLNEPVVAAVDD